MFVSFDAAPPSVGFVHEFIAAAVRQGLTIKQGGQNKVANVPLAA